MRLRYSTQGAIRTRQRTHITKWKTAKRCIFECLWSILSTPSDGTRSIKVSEPLRRTGVLFSWRAVEKKKLLKDIKCQQHFIWFSLASEVTSFLTGANFSAENQDLLLPSRCCFLQCFNWKVTAAQRKKKNCLTSQVLSQHTLRRLTTAYHSTWN